ncbi:uncharacterized protein LOC129917843 isoform X1 [Episyrphus balteatus]|uniref:uncharacterized protein LOC129917843 isoform X1 n=1 Tax=Episyrphus balteatus TaxID=286459 RepID=UPI0024856726|nr:uncharacterized protein LOC129917843 isoform X1 [Episyrphus balteatus]
MPNVTYIKFVRNFFNATNGQLPFAAIHTNVSNAYPDNVILLIEEHNTGTNDDDDDGFHMRSTTSVTLMIMAWVFMIIGFTLCWCFQLFEKQKSQMHERCSTRNGNDWEESDHSNVHENHSNGTQALESIEEATNDGRRRCFVLDGEQFDDETETSLSNGGDVDRTSDTLNPGDVIRRYDMDVESLPSYTIVSGLPSYDDALDEFRKAGLILKPPIPVIKIFDSDTKDPPSIGEDGLPEYSPPENTTTCVCGNGSQIIELNPEHLKILSQKRLSLQISFNGLPNNIRRNSRPRVDLCQQVGRNNLLRAQRDRELLTPEIHRSSSMTLDDERNMIEHRLRKLEQHRGSIS